MITIGYGEVYIDGDYYGIDRTVKAYYDIIERKNQGEEIDEQYLKDLDRAMEYFYGCYR